MKSLKADELAAIEQSKECVVCGHLAIFHDDGDYGHGAGCNVTGCRCDAEGRSPTSAFPCDPDGLRERQSGA